MDGVEGVEGVEGKEGVAVAAGGVTEHQGLTLVHFSAQREHFLSHVVGCFAVFSGTNGSS